MNRLEIKSYIQFFALLLFLLSFINSFSQNYQWAKSIGGSADDIGNSIAVDELGNVFVMGRFNGTVDFDPGHGSNSLTPVQGLDIFFAKYDSSTITGVNTYSVEKSIHLYPNPNDGKFTIQYSEGQNYVGGKIEIYSMLGENLHSEKINDVYSTTVELNLPQGMYILRIATNEGETLEKIVIQ